MARGMMARATTILILIWSIVLVSPLAAEAWAAGAHVTPEQQLSHLLTVRQSRPHVHAHDGGRHDSFAVGEVAGASLLSAPTPTDATSFASLWHAILAAASPLLLLANHGRARHASARITSFIADLTPRPPLPAVARLGGAPGGGDARGVGSGRPTIGR